MAGATCCAFMDAACVHGRLILRVVCVIHARSSMLMLSVVMCDATRGFTSSEFERNRLRRILNAKSHGRGCIALEGHCKQNEPQQKRTKTGHRPKFYRVLTAPSTISMRFINLSTGHMRFDPANSCTGCHSSRVSGITECLPDGGVLEVAQQMASHENASTTGLYDWR